MKWLRIAVHHSASPDRSFLDSEAIRRFHTDPPPRGRGWSDVGYHCLVEKVGSVYIALMGRPWYRTGSHARGKNTGTLGIVLIGNYEHKQPPLAQIECAAEWCAAMCVATGIRTAAINPHRELGTTRTICPGLTDVERLRWLVGRLRGGRVHRAKDRRGWG